MNIEYLYPSRAEIEACWERGEAPPFGFCPACDTVRPLELDGSCCGCGTKSMISPEFFHKTNGRWQRREGTK